MRSALRPSFNQFNQLNQLSWGRNTSRNSAVPGINAATWPFLAAPTPRSLELSPEVASIPSSTNSGQGNQVYPLQKGAAHRDRRRPNCRCKDCDAIKMLSKYTNTPGRSLATMSMRCWNVWAEFFKAKGIHRNSIRPNEVTIVVFGYILRPHRNLMIPFYKINLTKNHFTWQSRCEIM